MSGFISSTPVSTPRNRLNIMSMSPLSPIASISSLENDSEIDFFVQRGERVRNTMYVKSKKPVENQLSVHLENWPKDTTDKSIVSSPFLTRWCSLRANQERTLFTRHSAPPENTNRSLLNTQRESTEEIEGKKDSTFCNGDWSRDESTETPWTKAARKEYLLKTKRKSQKKKSTSKAEKRLSPIALLKKWILKKPRF